MSTFFRRLQVSITTLCVLSAIGGTHGAEGPADSGAVRDGSAIARSTEGADAGTASDARAPIGLVLAGGGARGAAHIGALKVLEELRVPVDYIAGTSMGSIVGGMYAVGYSPAEMEEILGEINWKSVFRDQPDRRMISYRRKVDDNLPLFPFEFGIGKKGLSHKGGVVTASKVEAVFQFATLDAAGVHRFDDLRIPYRAIAADLETGDAVVLDHGNLAEAMRASMSIPGAFTPVVIDGRILVDGGIADNMPVDVARGMGARRVIAIDVGTPPKTSAHGLSGAGVLSQTLAVLSEKNVIAQRASLGPGDLLITPELEGIGAAGFGKIDEAIAAGEAAARLLTDRLRAYSVSEAEYDAFLKRQRRGKTGLLPQVTIDEVVVEGVPHLDPKVLTRRMETKPGRQIELDALRRDLRRVNRAGEFMKVGFRLDQEGDQNRLVVQAYPKTWGPGYLRAGMTMETNLAGDSNIALLAYYRRAQVNRLGAEWKNIFSFGTPTSVFSEFYQPLTTSGLVFVAPSMQFKMDEFKLVLPDGTFESVKNRTLDVSGDVGLNLWHYASLRVGVQAGRERIEPRTTSAYDGISVDTGGFRFRFDLDQVDNTVFPTSGNRSRIAALFSRGSLGADVDYDRVLASTQQAFTLRRNTFLAGLVFGTDLGSNLPVYDQFELGGFLALSGYRKGFVRGDVMGRAALTDYVKVGELPAGLGSLYAGIQLQSGNAWMDASLVSSRDLHYSGTLFFGVDNRLSPVFLGYGRGDGGEGEVYVFVGRPF